MSTDLVRHGNRKSSPAVPEKVRAAAEILATTPGSPDYAAIAKAVGYTNAKMLRRALSLPQSIRFLRDYKRQVLEEINIHNPERLRRIADAEGGNAMAKVAAVRGLELMQNGDDSADLNRMQRQGGPGVTIIVEAGPGASAKVLNPAPVIEHEPDRHTYPSVD
jgi:hypothetical protein